MMIYNEDLLKDISEKQLLQMSDINGTGKINQDVIDDALNDAISLVESFIILPDAPTALLKKIVVDMTIYELKRKNGFIEEIDKELKKENEAYLLKMSTGRLKKEIDTHSNTLVDKKYTPFAFSHQKRKRIKKGGFR